MRIRRQELQSASCDRFRLIMSWRQICVPRFRTYLVHGHAQLPQLGLGELDFAHEFLVCLGTVVEGHDAPAETDEEVRAEGDESPERKLKSL